MKRPGIFLLTLALCASLLWGCTPKDQTVICGKLTVTLPGTYQDKGNEPYADGLDLLYSNETVAVMVTSEDASVLTAYFPDMGAMEYAQLFLQSNGLPGNVKSLDSIPIFTYTRDSGSTSLTYLCGVFASAQRFWVVQLYCDTQLYPKQQAQMQQILSSVRLG